MMMGIRANLSSYERNRAFSTSTANRSSTCHSPRGRHRFGFAQCDRRRFQSRRRDRLAGGLGRRRTAALVLESLSEAELDCESNWSASRAIEQRSARESLPTSGHDRSCVIVFPVNGFMGQGPVETILGLGSAARIDRLEVRWPTGKIQVFENLPATSLSASSKVRMTSAATKHLPH